MRMFQQRSEDRIIEFAYSTPEMLDKVQQLKAVGGPYVNNHIYIFTKSTSEFNALKRDPDITVYKPWGIRNTLMALFTNENPIESGFRRLDLKVSERKEYAKIIKNGGMILVSGFDPFGESPLSESYYTKNRLEAPDYSIQRARGPLATLFFGQNKNIGQELPSGFYPNITDSPHFMGNTARTSAPIKRFETVEDYTDTEVYEENLMDVASEYGENNNPPTRDKTEK